MNYKILSRLIGVIGLITFIVSEILLFKKVEPVYTWFYSFAWWSYIFMVDSIVYQREGKSLIITRFREFLCMIPWSVAFWLFFEMANLNLNNWHYVELPLNRIARWIGYFIAYATIMPALFETKELLESFKFFKKALIKKIRVTRAWYIHFVVVGFLFLFLPLLFPKYFFPLIWGAFIFLLEPALHRFNGGSLLKQWEEGTLRDFFLLLFAGFICGGLWEFWNFWAQARWVYTVPWVGNLKIFEMPVLGFLGFPPFTVEIFVMWNAVLLLKKKKFLPSFIPLMPVFLIYYYICFQAIDLFTVHSFQ